MAADMIINLILLDMWDLETEKSLNLLLKDGRQKERQIHARPLNIIDDLKQERSESYFIPIEDGLEDT